MAYEKQNWKDALQAAKPKGSGSNNDSDQREQKNIARLMYSRRVLEKSIKEYIKKNKSGIRYRDIEKIGRQYGFYIS